MDTDYDEPIQFESKPKPKRSSVTYGKRRGQQRQRQPSASPKRGPSSGERALGGGHAAELGKRGRREIGNEGEEDADSESNSSEFEEKDVAETERRGEGLKLSKGQVSDESSCPRSLLMNE